MGSSELFCDICGSELEEDSPCALCTDSVNERFQGLGGPSEFVLELPYGFAVDCMDDYILDNIRAEAETFQAEEGIYQQHDWSAIADLLRTKVLTYVEENITQKRQLSQLALQQQRALGSTRQQRMQERGTGRSLLDMLREEYSNLLRYYDEHAGEFAWEYSCPECNLKTVKNMLAPHPMFDYGGGEADVWMPGLLPLLKRYYSVRGATSPLPISANYSLKDWMDRPEWDGGISVPDAARLLNMSPVGVLYALWAHSEDSGAVGLPRLMDMVGFEFNIDKPETMKPFLPEGSWDSKDFLGQLQYYQSQKKRLEEAREWRRENVGLMFVALLLDRLQFFDYFGPRLCRPIPWKTWWSQIPGTLADTSLERDGRGTGKSERVKLTAIQSSIRLAIEAPGDIVLVATPDEQHTRPVYQKIFSAFEADEFLSQFLATGNKRTSSRHGGEIHLSDDDCVIYLRFPGKNTKDAFNLQQYHASAMIVDEAGFWPAAAERAVSSSLNTQRCVCQKYFGVVIHEDPRLPIYFYSKWPDKFTKFRRNLYSMASLINIYEYNLQKHQEQLEILGGSVRSEAYARQILGMLGEPTELEFSEEELNRVFIVEAFPYEENAKYRFMGVTDRTFTTLSNESQMNYFKSMSYWPGKDDLVRGDQRRCMFGFDYGSTAPSQLWVMCYNEEKGAWRLVYRVTMTGVEDENQIEVIDHLDTVYSPYKIAMDTSGTHNRVAGLMTSGLSVSLAHKEYDRRIWRVSFNKDMVIKYWDEPPADLTAKVVREVVDGHILYAEKEPTRAWAINRLHYWFQHGLLELPKHDDRLRKEFGKFAMRGGKWVGEDHNIAALSTFVVAHWHEYELKTPERPETERVAVKPRTFDSVAIWNGQVQRPVRGSDGFVHVPGQKTQAPIRRSYAGIYG